MFRIGQGKFHKGLKIAFEIADVETALTGGEGWHNNHHEDQASASVQHRWWELDPNYYIIKTLEWMGLATHIVPPRWKRQAGRQAAE